MLTKTRFGQLIFVDTRDVSISPHIIMSGDWEPWVTDALSRTFLWAGSTFIDVGANCGWYSLLAAARGMKVMSFEPNVALCTLMGQTRAVNGFTDRWQIMDRALSAKTGEAVTLMLDAYNQGGAHLEHAPGYPREWGETVDALPHPKDGVHFTSCLDDEVPPGTKVDLIKIDVEGYEHAVLQGAQRILSENQDLVLAVEHHAGDREMIEWLQGLGFELGHFSHAGRVVDCSIDAACALADAEMLCFSRS
jgi:FkbM family methyltransferase